MKDAPLKPRSWLVIHSMWSSCASGYGRGRSMKTSTALKTDVLAPIPIASERTAMVMRPFPLRRVRRANFVSCQMMSIVYSVRSRYQA